MISPKVRDEISVTTKKRRRQTVSTDDPVGLRILSCLGDNDYAWLSAQTGIPQTTLSDCIKKGISRSDNALKIADGLGVTVDWLLRGNGVKSENPNGKPKAFHPIDVDHLDWVNVPEYDLRELTDETRGSVVSETPIRKDWLYQTFGTTSGLWLAKLPADLPRLSLREGDLVFLRDIAPGEAQDGAVYIVRVWGHLTVARLDALLANQMRSIDANIEDRVIAPRDIGTEDGKAILVARVMGAPLRRL